MRKIILEELRRALFDRTTSLDELPESVWKATASLNTWGTNSIEGNTVTREEAEMILLRRTSVAGRPLRDVLETIQHERAFLGLLERRGGPITLETVLDIHKEVFFGILLDAGQWRRVNVRIIGANFTPPRMEKVLPEIRSWIEEFNYRDTEGEEVFRLGTWLHHEFERVHPFSDGNGRVGRLLVNLFFLKRNWPPVSVLPRHRDEYLFGLQEAQNGKQERLENLFRILMGATLLQFLDAVGTAEDELLTLKDISGNTSYGVKYLAMRCKHGELPGVKIGKVWRTSGRALALYREHVAR